MRVFRQKSLFALVLALLFTLASTSVGFAQKLPVLSPGASLDPNLYKELPLLTLEMQDMQSISGKGAGLPLEWQGPYGLALRFYQGNYWTDNKYSVAGFKTRAFQIQVPQANMPAIQAWQIQPPDLDTSLKFIASGTSLWFKANPRGTYRLWEIFDEKSFLRMPAGAIRYRNLAFMPLELLSEGAMDAEGRIEIKSIHPHEFKATRSFCVLPATRDLSPEGNAWLLAKTELGNFSRLDLPAPGLSALWKSEQEAKGPYSSTYGTLRLSPAQVLDDQSLLVPYQDKDKKLFLGRLDSNGTWTQTLLPGLSGSLLAFTAEQNRVYYLLSSAGENPVIELYSATLDGSLLKKTRLGNKTDAFNIWNQDSYPVSLAVGNGTLVLVISRRMQKGGDGLNHQGSISASFDATTLEIKAIHGQNSGHSFNSRLVFDGTQFFSMDLGDNYPRGIIMYRYANGTRSQGRVVFTFKTNHPNKASPYRSGLGPGKWSNDNETYTEFGDMQVLNEGIGVLVASEKSIRNQDTGATVNEARNLAYILVSKDFASKPQKDNVVTNQIVISKGEDSPDFGFYNFDGGYSAQKRVGVLWLTDYKNKDEDNVARPKLLTLNDGRLLALWERWSKNGYQSSHALYLDAQGNRLGPVLNLGSQVRFPREDSLLVLGTNIVWSMPGDERMIWYSLSTSPSISPNTNKVESVKTEEAGKAEKAFEGSWTTWWSLDGSDTQSLVLKVQDGIVRGTYLKGKGTLEGSIEDAKSPALLSGSWQEADGKKGWFRFLLSADGKNIDGRWGIVGQSGEGLWRSTRQ